MLTTFGENKRESVVFPSVLDVFLSTPALTQLVAASSEGQE